jgi:catechol 2,3-dioxygenase-like lactoylglutathione lyase family enzyme
MPATTTTVGVRYMIDDVADAVAFYTTHLGFTLQQDAAPAFAAVSRDGVRLLLSGQASSGRRPMPDGTRPVPGGWNRIHLQVADLAAEVERLRAAGCRFRNDIITDPAARRSCWRTPPATPSSCSSLRSEDPAAVLEHLEHVAGDGERGHRTGPQQRQRPLTRARL